MDSYNFHFEKMSNFDLHPLSVSRLSPAKSSSSIDHYSHHHSKGDSAYSSFSGGSSAPDYHSPFLVDELHPHGLHYADLKYIKGVYGPHIVQSVSKTVPYQTDAFTHLHQDHDGCPQRVLENPPAPSSPLTPPPKPPVRLESLKTKTRYVQISDSDVLSPRSDSRSSHNFSTNQDLECKSVQLSPRDQYRQPQHNMSIHNPPSAKDGGSDSGQHSWNSTHMVGGSIQHKGQYYFVTGMYKSSEFADPSESRHTNVPDGSSGTLFFQERNTLTASTHHQGDEDTGSLVSNYFGKLESSSLGGDPEDNQQGMNVNTHHPANHPIFYCGPETGVLPSANQIVIPLNADGEQHVHRRNGEDMMSRQPFADVPAEKISKESTPLLYHLTGASRTSVLTAVRNETHSDLPSNEQNWSKEKQKSEKKSNSYCSEPRSDMVKEVEPNQLPYPCGTVDDSFRKYYKAKLKDVQSKVLRETSFKRRDLQLSLPSRIENPSDEGLSEFFSEFSSAPQTQDLKSKLEKAPPQLHMFQEPGKEAFRNCADENELETLKPKNVAQPQAPRVGWRRRLNLEQKKLSRSEPEKLDQLTDRPTHVACRSLGSEHESHLLEDPHTEQGLVASRRKIFEMRGRALSASSFSKSSLKHLQQKALLAYVERKTGTKVAEPQQVSPQLPVPGRLSDPTPHSGQKKKKLPRPLSAGRLLDLTSVRYAQFSRGHSRQSSWFEGLSTPVEVSDSSEFLPYKQEQPPAYRSRSTSIPHTLHQIYKQMIPSAAVRKEASRAQQLDEERTTYKEYAASVPDQRSIRLVASRGKSMEELGVAKVWRPKVLSKSSEHLHHLQENTKLSEKDMAFLNQRLEKVQQNDPQHGTVSAGSGTNGNAQLGSEHPYTTEPCPKSDLTSTAPHRGTATSPDTHSTSGADVPLCHPMITTNELPATFQHSTASPTLSTTSGISKMNAVQEVALSLGVTTEPSLWLSSDLDVGQSDEDASETQEAQPQCEGMGAASNLSPPDAKPECSLEEGKEKSEDETHVTKSQWEILVEEVVAADQSLACVLFPITNRKTAVMLLEQLLCEDTLLMEEHYRRKQEQQGAPQNQADHSPDRTTAHDAPNDGDTFGGDVTEKKRQLMTHIENQLKSLEGLRSSLQVEQKENSVQGESIAAQVRECCLPAELERYTQFVEDLERVINLLLCLSARLARVQNTLSTVDSNMDSEEKQSLEKRHHFLCKQRDDAKDLKDNLDRRERIVATFLSRQLPESRLQEYKRFVQIKASLLIRQKDLEEKQRLGEEQLDGILNSIPP